MPSRREFTKAILGASCFSLANAKSSHAALAHSDLSRNPFAIGVASGDPQSDSVTIWTRLIVDPQSENTLQEPILVTWIIASDPELANVVLSGTTLASPKTAHSVHVRVLNLMPMTQYWYQFNVGSHRSDVGRTRTLASESDEVNELNFAVVSCQHYEQGFFTPYKFLAREDLDFVIHLGDYIYEKDSPTQKFRDHLGPEPYNLEQYRMRYAQYKSDRYLQLAHAAFPWIMMWDDHEVDNDYASDLSEDYSPPNTFAERRKAAYQAFLEHQPLQTENPGDVGTVELYRNYTIGNLATFYLLDVRQYRSDQPCGTTTSGGGQIVQDCGERNSQEQTMLGKTQTKWLQSKLTSSSSKWNLIAQPLLMSQLDEIVGTAKGFWTDAWDGYTVSRQMIFDTFVNSQVNNPVVLSGDIHSFWAIELKTDFNEIESQTIAAEFVGTSLSSFGVPFDQFNRFLKENRHVKYFESRERGYMKCNLKRDILTVEFIAVPTTRTENLSKKLIAKFIVQDGNPEIKRVI